MMVPMAEFVSDGEPLTTRWSPIVYADDCTIATSNDPCFARMQFTIFNPGSKLPSNCFEIDLFRSLYPKIL